jgi:hypothetical protein
VDSLFLQEIDQSIMQIDLSIFNAKVCIGQWIIGLDLSIIYAKTMQQNYALKICKRTMHWNYALKLCKNYAFALCNRQTESRGGTHSSKLSNYPSAKSPKCGQDFNHISKFSTCLQILSFRLYLPHAQPDLGKRLLYALDYLVLYRIETFICIGQFGSTGCEFKNKIHVQCCFLKHVLYSTECMST